MPRSGVISLDLGIESFNLKSKKKNMLSGVHVPHLDNTFKSQI